MGKRQYTYDVQEPKVGVDEKTSSGVQGSGRFLFALAKILVDVIDDELQVSDAHKCAGKKVDMGKRVVRAAANVVSKVSKNQAVLGGAKDQLAAEQLGFAAGYLLQFI
jgi:hypothetical protein